MKISAEQHGATTILRPSGLLPSGQLNFELRDRVAQAVTGGARHVVLDLSEVPQVDSLGVGEIVAAYTAARTRDAAISLVGLSPRVRQVMTASNLRTILPIFGTVQEAEAAVLASSSGS